jgi:hypothetical protein
MVHCAHAMNHLTGFLAALYDRFGDEQSASPATSKALRRRRAKRRNLEIDGWVWQTPKRLPDNRKETK